MEPVLHIVPGGEDGESGDPVSFLEDPKTTADVAFDVLPGAGISGVISGIIAVEVTTMIADLVGKKKVERELAKTQVESGSETGPLSSSCGPVFRVRPAGPGVRPAGNPRTLGIDGSNVRGSRHPALRCQMPTSRPPRGRCLY